MLHPSALTEYDTTEDTIVISCEDTGKTTTVSFDDILVMDQYSYYYYGTTSYTEFDGEGQLTGAVNYVTNDTDHTIYQTTGHGESSLSTTITDLMEKNSYTLSEVNLLMTTSIPDDCDLLLMYAPTTDLSEDEAQMLRDYLAGGGKVMILSGDAKPCRASESCRCAEGVRHRSCRWIYRGSVKMLPGKLLLYLPGTFCIR